MRRGAQAGARSAWRMPLQTGEAALHALAKGALLWFPTMAFFLASFVVVSALGSDQLAGLLMAPSAILAYFTWKQLKRAWELRPSDLELTDEAFWVRGGPRDGFSMYYRSVRAALVMEGKPQSASLLDSPDDTTDLHSLWIHRGEDRGTPVAFAGSPAERASLEDVAATLMAARQAQPEPTRAEPKHEVLRCPLCRGPVAPAADAQTRCPWCSQPVEVPPTTREKVKAAQVLARHPAKVVEQVLAQTPARLLELQYRAIALVMLVAWPVAVGVTGYNLSRQASTAGSILLVTFFLLGTVLGAAALFRTRIAERQALRLLTVRFAARPAEAEGKPRACRVCAGPLADAAQAVLVVCAWCDAPNVVGFDHRAHARAALEEARSLEEVLQRRAQERQRWAAVGVAGVVLLVASAWALLAAMGRA